MQTDRSFHLHVELDPKETKSFNVNGTWMEAETLGNMLTEYYSTLFQHMQPSDAMKIDVQLQEVRNV